MADDELTFETLAVHGGDEEGDELEAPIHVTTAYRFADAADAAGRFAGSGGEIYQRWRNPTVRSFERLMAALEGTEDAVAFGSGMGAISACVGAFCGTGDHVVAPASVYAETAKVLRGPFARAGVETTFVDATDPVAVEAAIGPRTRLILAETPANPVLAISDLGALAGIAERAEARLVVDSTFATPYHQRPVAHGAHLVVHSATKAIGGHGDVLGGVAAGSRDDVAAVREHGIRSMGSVLAPMAAFFLSRGVRTLPLRMERSSATAFELARRLEADARIADVRYPGLESHPGHGVAARQMERGFGAMVAFEVTGGLDAGRRLYDRLELLVRAVSLGDTKTLVTHPASTTHFSMSAEQRQAAGITDGLLRLSVGLEDVEDLWRDLDRALG